LYHKALCVNRKQKQSYDGYLCLARTGLRAEIGSAVFFAEDFLLKFRDCLANAGDRLLPP
jgi:hypothetical protein